MQPRLQLWLLTFLRRLIVSVRQLLRLAATTTSNPNESVAFLKPPSLTDLEPFGPSATVSGITAERQARHQENLYCIVLEQLTKGSTPLVIDRYQRASETTDREKTIRRLFRFASQGAPNFEPCVIHSLPGSFGFANDNEKNSSPLEAEADLPLFRRLQRPTLDPKNAITRLQRAHALLAWLVRFYLHFTSPRPNAKTVVPTPGSIAHSLIWLSRWLKSALVLIYPSTNLWNLGLENDQPFSADRMTSELVEEPRKALPRRASPQPQPPRTVSQVPGASALCKTYFIPANRSLIGSIEKPNGNPICAGGYSDVWRCNIRFSTPSGALPPQVAVKVLRSVWLSNRNETDANERKLRRFKQEVITWLGLPEHPNIVPLIGWTLTPDLSFVSPWYKQGNLYRHLKNLSDTRRIQILLGIAKGLECLHSRSPPVVHGDLKPENILMSDLGEPLLADFGLSTILGEERMYTSSHRVGGSVPWMSPEQRIGGLRSCESDVYSFGSLAFTVMTGETPYAGLTEGQITLKVCNSKKDPIEDWSKYPQLLGPIQALLQDCWSRSPDARPSMTSIVQRLTTLLGSSALT